MALRYFIPIRNAINYTLFRNTYKQSIRVPKSNLHSSVPCCDLMEFFDNPKNWGEKEVRVGREWKMDELRIKSSEDLHKLWYVLLKEKNMLLTMEHEAQVQSEPFPNPERIDRVEISMENLEEVIKERNKAYLELETGKTGLKETDIRLDMFGRIETYHKEQHLLPKAENPDYEEPDHLIRSDSDVYSFLREMNEQIDNNVSRQRRKELKECWELFKRFPDMDLDALKDKYPDLNIDKIYNQYLQTI